MLVNGMPKHSERLWVTVDRDEFIRHLPIIGVS